MGVRGFVGDGCISQNAYCFFQPGVEEMASPSTTTAPYSWRCRSRGHIYLCKSLQFLNSKLLSVSMPHIWD